jgi:uncharacterized membrane protein
LASLAVHQPIWFGILHFLASCILLAWLLEKIHAAIPVVLLAAFVTTLLGVGFWPVVESADYFPLLPWGYLFFLRYYLGKPIKEKTPRLVLFPEDFFLLNSSLPHTSDLPRSSADIISHSLAPGCAFLAIRQFPTAED